MSLSKSPSKDLQGPTLSKSPSKDLWGPTLSKSPSKDLQGPTLSKSPSKDLQDGQGEKAVFRQLDKMSSELQNERRLREGALQSARRSSIDREKLWKAIKEARTQAATAQKDDDPQAAATSLCDAIDQLSATLQNTARGDEDVASDSDMESPSSSPARPVWSRKTPRSPNTSPNASSGRTRPIVPGLRKSLEAVAARADPADEAGGSPREQAAAAGRLNVRRLSGSSAADAGAGTRSRKDSARLSLPLSATPLSLATPRGSRELPTNLLGELGSPSNSGLSVPLTATPLAGGGKAGSAAPRDGPQLGRQSDHTASAPVLPIASPQVTAATWAPAPPSSVAATFTATPSAATWAEGASFAAPAVVAAWSPDTPNCALCGAGFGAGFLKSRRHHCRRCGKCVCNPCSPFRMHLENPVTKDTGSSRRTASAGASFHGSFREDMSFDMGAGYPPENRLPAGGSEEMAYMLDNSRMQSSARGIGWRTGPCITDIDDQVLGPRWGDIFQGTRFGENWLKVGDRYLPMALDGVQVISPAPGSTQSFQPPDRGISRSSSQMNVRRASQKIEAYRVCSVCHLIPLGSSSSSFIALSRLG